MTRTYVTFGQVHTHRVNGKTFDCDCVAAIDDPGDRSRIFETFGDKFFTTYDDFSKVDMKYFPRGVIEVD